MLSRTAESLFWTARHMERADNIARRLEVGYRMSLMPNETTDINTEWHSILNASNALDNFYQHHEEINQANIEDFLIYDKNNPSSIKNCIKNARNNGREARTAITTDVWYSLNQSYLEFKTFENRRLHRIDLPSLCDWVKRQVATLRGAHINTQLYDDGADFFNLGCFIERADNTARLLDIKYHVLLPTIDMVGKDIDNYQWTSLLRGVSAYRAYHWAYRGDQTPQKIADFLILNPTCPRSLRYCVAQTSRHLNRLNVAYSSYSPAQHMATLMHEELKVAQVNGILKDGLHEFLMQFILKNNQLANSVGESFLFAER
ncbi:MAG: alpha-E domain-containing protein [Acidiferrobacterales bacterium]|nr:alpha-E domain-containing protein [Acidiferrobacterales bacterium]